MNLRSGKRLQSTKPIITYELEEKHYLNISYLLLNLINAMNDDKIIAMSKEERFNEKVRFVRELYYLIEFYNLKNIPRFEKFIHGCKIKAKCLLEDLNYNLHPDKGFRITQQERNAARYLEIELLDFLQ